MLRRFTITILAALALSLATNSVFAQKTVHLSKTPASFRTFFKKFSAAVNKGDGAAIASMTSFPFEWGFDTGDEGKWTRTQFLKNFGKVFIPQPLAFKGGDPEFTVEGSSYGVTGNPDDASYFTFKKKGSTYKLISYIVEP